MSSVNTVSTLNGLFKEVYASDLQNLLPDSAMLVKKIPFKQAEMTGKRFVQPVVLSREHGLTYATSGDAFAINPPIAQVIGEQQIDGAEMLLASRMSYLAAQKAVQGKRAFKNGTQHLVESMLESLTQRLEVSMLYGGRPLARGASISGTGTARVITFTAGSWADGIWSGQEKAAIDAYNATTKLNTNADIVITAVDPENRRLTVSGNASDLTAIDSVVASLDVYFKGAYGNEMAGIDRILTNTGSLFNIDAAAYSLWKSTSYAVGGAISMAKIQQAVAQAVARGLNEKVVVLLNPKKFEVLNSDLAALRRLDGSYDSKKGEAGTETLVYHGSNGLIEIMPHSMVKESEAFVLPISKVKRIGACDVTFNPSQSEDDKVFIELSGNSGFELRAYTHQQVFVEAPARCVKLTGIT